MEAQLQKFLLHQLKELTTAFSGMVESLKKDHPAIYDKRSVELSELIRRHDEAYDKISQLMIKGEPVADERKFFHQLGSDAFTVLRDCYQEAGDERNVAAYNAVIAAHDKIVRATDERMAAAWKGALKESTDLKPQ